MLVGGSLEHTYTKPKIITTGHGPAAKNMSAHGREGTTTLGLRHMQIMRCQWPAVRNNTYRLQIEWECQAGIVSNVQATPTLQANPTFTVRHSQL
jgi:hypothetical protein